MRFGLAVLVGLGHLRHKLEPPRLTANDVDPEEAEGAIKFALIEVQLVGILACAIASEHFAELAQYVLSNSGGFRKLPVGHLNNKICLAAGEQNRQHQADQPLITGPAPMPDQVNERLGA